MKKAVSILALGALIIQERLGTLISGLKLAVIYDTVHRTFFKAEFIAKVGSDRK